MQKLLQLYVVEIEQHKVHTWGLAEFYHNRDLQKPYTGTCTILHKTINRFLCLLIVFLESKIHQLNFEEHD